ncbi:MAG: acyl carrier protein [Spirochaetales bacterium]|jgi:acyl carrier protein|nr:acyl carrier protein [Spirochaetales bacterium]MBQ7508105.1 acyl carrier protein [Spirochaetales bacterium]MBR6347349.1 acyl carrier protein [Spirochaetales bacterium]
MLNEKIKDILHKVAPDFDLSTLSNDTDLRKDLGMDSLAMMMVSMELEDTFSFRFDEPVDFRTVGDVLTFLKDKKGLTD